MGYGDRLLPSVDRLKELMEAAKQEPSGRLLLAVYKLAPDCRMTAAARESKLTDGEFVSAVAQAESAQLVEREERDGAVYLKLTERGRTEHRARRDRRHDRTAPDCAGAVA
jgi:DNA-binding MarR family transcriptional regulator